MSLTNSFADPVEVRMSPTNTTVNETDLVDFVCEAFGLPQPTFIWSTPTSTDLSNRADTDPNLSIRSNSRSRGSNEGVTVQSILRFVSINDTDAGMYTCAAMNVPKQGLNSFDSATFNIVVQSEQNE